MQLITDSLTFTGVLPTSVQTGPTLSASYTTIPLGQQAIITFQAKLFDNITTGQTITNIAPATWTSLSAQYNNTILGERNGAGGVNNYLTTGTATVYFNPIPDVGVVITAPTTINAGSVLQYTINYYNSGDTTATGVSILVTLPWQFSIDTGNLGTMTLSGNVLTIPGITIPAG